MLIIPKPPPEPAELDLRPRHPFRRAAWRALQIFGALLLLLVLAGIFFRMLAMFRETKDRTEIAPQGGRFLPAEDVQLFVQDVGPREGPVVVLVSGPGTWSEVWRETMDALVASGFRVVALDMPPFGFSEKPKWGGYSPGAQGKRIVGVLETIRSPKLTLVGHSSGAAYVVEAAIQVPHQVRSLVLVDAALGLEPEEPTLGAGLLGFGPLRNAFVATFVTNPWMTEIILGRSVSDRSALTPERIAMLQRPLAAEGTTDAVGKWLQQILGPDRSAWSSRRSAYASLISPTLVVWGREDEVEPLARGESLNTLLPDSELAVVEGAGHSPHIENPGEFNDILLGFLERHGRE